MAQRSLLSRLVVGVALLLAMLALASGLFLRPVRQVILWWLVADFGLITAWVAGSVFYVAFLKQDTTANHKFVKVDFTRPAKEIATVKVAVNVPPTPPDESKLTIKHG